jgi:23S rRNA (uracil1939-C5)-methyltransferase
VASVLKRAIRATGVEPYQDRPHRGDLRAVQVVVERASQRAQVVLVGNAEAPEPLLPLAAALRAELGDVLHSLWWNGNPERTNVILGSRWMRLAGEPFVCESIGGARIYFPPGAFGQSHLELADRLVERVHEWVPDGAVVAEYYAGCGAIGLGLARRCRDLRVNERSPEAVEGLRRGIFDLPAADRTRVRVLAGEASAAAEAALGADLVIVDPPRKGLDADLARALCRAAPARIVYVSCDPVSLERDLYRLEDGAGLALRALEAFALFPYTDHAESLALLERPGAVPATRLTVVAEGALRLP